MSAIFCDASSCNWFFSGAKVEIESFKEMKGTFFFADCNSWIILVTFFVWFTNESWIDFLKKKLIIHAIFKSWNVVLLLQFHQFDHPLIFVSQ